VPKETTGRFTKAERVDAYRINEGRCFVCDQELDPLGAWHAARHEDGDTVVLCHDCSEVRRGRTFGELRYELQQRVLAAREAEARWGPLLAAGDSSAALTFAGEPFVGEPAPAALEAEPAL
jgi:hypothetical protein